MCARQDNGVLQEDKKMFCKNHRSHADGEVSIITTVVRKGSVVEYLTRDRGAAGSSLTGVTASWSLSKTHLS